jgi:putative ABC transport system substrate-binding protein
VTLEPALFEPGAHEAAYRRAFDKMAATGPDAMLSANSADNNANARLLAEMTLAAKLPAMAELRSFARLGVLMSYGPNLVELRRRSAGYVDRILRGERPGDLPIQQPTLFDLFINMGTVRALGITIAPGVMLQATELIE